MGPTLAISEDVHAMKYRQEGETFQQAMTRVADALKDNDHHFNVFRDILLDQRFLPAGRVQAAMGAVRKVTPYNCFVSCTIDDSMAGIMEALAQAAQTMRLGGGIGYDFSTLRPAKDTIKSLASCASGPVSFMQIFDALCKTISSAGHRRGAQMGMLRVDHPDIEEFVRAKNNTSNLTAFNISVAITDDFMKAVKEKREFPLKFNEEVYKVIDAHSLWEEIMRSTWDWAEPGVIFIDRINQDNNLWYCEDIAATNPCGEQPLPPNGACLLGSFNMVKYVKSNSGWKFGQREIDYHQFKIDIQHVVRAMDNIIDRAIYPLKEQEREAKSKRRMGLGVTGVANAIESLGYPYGCPTYINFQNHILEILRDTAYYTSVDLAKEKGSFPAFNATDFLASGFCKKLPPMLRRQIQQHGIRNSHLTSIAPTGTISLAADNISSGIEPVFSLTYCRKINTPTGPMDEVVEDYGYRVFGTKGKTADVCTPDEHVNVLNAAAWFIDSAVSKTCNIGQSVAFKEFKEVYWKAYEGGAKGCTTFRAAGKRMGVLVKKDEDEGLACRYDDQTGRYTCDE